MKRVCVLLLVISVLAAVAPGAVSNAFSQVGGDSAASMLEKQAMRPSIGLTGGIEANEHLTNFRYLPGVLACSPTYKSGFGARATFGAQFAVPFTSSLGLSLRGVFANSSALLSVDEQTTIAGTTGAESATFGHTIDANLTSIDFEPLLTYQIIPNFRLMGGAAIGYLLTSTFHQVETFKSPSDHGVFENGLRTRDDVTGDIPGASKILASLVAGVGYELPLNAKHTLTASPEILTSFGLTDVASGLPWKVISFTGQLAISYHLPVEEAKPVEKPIEIPPPPVVVPKPIPEPPKPPALLASVNATGVESNGSEGPAAVLKVEELLETKMTPIVPYVFFDENSSAIPARYNQLSTDGTASFERSDLYLRDRMQLHHDVLNLLGLRMRSNPKSSLALTGCNAGTGKEQGDLALSKGRAEAVAHYLTNVWGISPHRLRVSARNLPESPSTLQDTDGIVENRRVEFTANDAKLFEPITAADTVRQPTPPQIRFRTTVASEAGVQHWSLSAAQKSTVLKTFEGTGDVPAKIDWTLDTDQTRIPKAPGTLDYTLAVDDKAGQHVQASGTLPVEQVTLQKKKVEFAEGAEIERYTLVLFDFKSAALSSNNRGVLEFVKSRIKPNSEVSIVGYADRTGESSAAGGAANKELSAARARNVEEALGLVGTSRASDARLFDNNLPEGRVYSRTVEITIRTRPEKRQ